MIPLTVSLWILTPAAGYWPVFSIVPALLFMPSLGWFINLTSSSLCSRSDWRRTPCWTDSSDCCESHGDPSRQEQYTPNALSLFSTQNQKSCWKLIKGLFSSSLIHIITYIHSIMSIPKYGKSFPGFISISTLYIDYILFLILVLLGLKKLPGNICERKTLCCRSCYSSFLLVLL